MAKQKPERQRYTIQCRVCKTKWESETINQCECGNIRLFADDHHTAKSRWFVNGVMLENN